MPFLWRSEWGFHALLLGIVLTLGFFLLNLTMVIILRKHAWAWVLAIGAIPLIVAAISIGALGEDRARHTIFDWNYPGYKSEVARLLKSSDSPGGPELVRALGGFGVYAATTYRPPGELEVEIDTISGPTVQSVLFSTQPVNEHEPYKSVTQVRKDDLGYWYFLD